MRALPWVLWDIPSCCTMRTLLWVLWHVPGAGNACQHPGEVTEPREGGGYHLKMWGPSCIHLRCEPVLKDQIKSVSSKKAPAQPCSHRMWWEMPGGKGIPNICSNSRCSHNVTSSTSIPPDPLPHPPPGKPVPGSKILEAECLGKGTNAREVQGRE